ncbi:MAG: transposase [Alphaproteobacteria bacterium]|nr:MAG: transposase [Alphaproteobacteria bacterium]
MARLARMNLPDVPQHIIQRGNNRQAIFFTDEDYKFYLDKLKQYAEQYNVAIHAFVLMTNHVHLLVTPRTKTGVSQMMQSLGQTYVRYINLTYKRTGTLCEGRYKSTLIDSPLYLLLVSRYIELNPVRAAMVSHPSEYPWSSFRGNAMNKQILLLTPHACYVTLGRNDADRREAYRALFDHSITDKDIANIRSVTGKGWVLGDERFKQQIAQTLGRRVTPKPRGGDRKSKAYHEKSKKTKIK